MKKLSRHMRQLICLITAIMLGAITVAPLFEQSVSALGGQVQSRSIELSNSTPSATSVTYNVSFKPTATGTVGGIVVDFCLDSPIIFSGTCTYPTAFTMGSTPSVTVTSGIGVGGSWVTTNSLQCGAAASNTQVLLYTNTTAQSVTAGTPVIFTINTVSNPSVTGTFYARIYTFDTSAHTISGYTCGTPTTRGATSATAGLLDYGGIALSTAVQIAITATVQETLTFCTSAAAPGAACSGTSAPNLTIGTGSPAVLDTTGEGTTGYTQLSTNAQSGVIVRMKAVNACTNGGLSTAPPDIAGGCLSIPGNGSTAQTFNAGCGAGAACFGLCVSPGAGVTADANYLDSVNSCVANTFSNTSKYGMDGTNLTSTYGDPIYSTAGAVSSINSQVTFVARAATTTPAGVYQGNEILIATGTF